MIHLAALPGTPHSALLPRQIADQAVAEARIYRDAGVDVLLIENMHDRPYLNRKVGPEITAAMTLAAQAVRGAVPELPLGIQVLAGANREALAIAYACDLQFIRAEALVFGHLADEGWMDADAGELLRYRRAVRAGGVAQACAAGAGALRRMPPARILPYPIGPGRPNLPVQMR